MSGALLSSDDLNDFIKPSVACIVKPITKKPTLEDSEDVIEVSIHDDNNNKNSSNKLEAAQISLTDCLACSGCITSAEEILVAQHSHKELINVLHNNANDSNLSFVVSVSPQSRASLANVYDISVNDADLMLIDFFINKLKFKYIVGTQFGRIISLKETLEEIELRKESKKQGPLMSSVCPGYVLYVEKTHPEVIDNLSKVRSPQSITGSILKATASRELQVPMNKIFHVAIMPCFDKKLEAARENEDENNEEKESPVKEVDIVITAKEFVQLSLDLKIDLKTATDKSFINNAGSEYHDALTTRYSPELFQFGKESWYSNLGSTSGGYANYYIEYLRNVKYKDEPIEVKVIEGRNKDIWEYRVLLTTDDGKKVAVGSTAVVNGFRNIQNLIRKLNEMKGVKTMRKKKVIRRRVKGNPESSNLNKENEVETIDLMKCDYIEVMACPGGCINGGGQISNGSDAKIKDSEWKELVVNKYYEGIPMIADMNDLELNGKLDQYLDEFSKSFHIGKEKLLFTNFKDVKSNGVVDAFENSAIALTSKW